MNNILKENELSKTMKSYVCFQGWLVQDFLLFECISRAANQFIANMESTVDIDQDCFQMSHRLIECICFMLLFVIYAHKLTCINIITFIDQINFILFFLISYIFIIYFIYYNFWIVFKLNIYTHYYTSVPCNTHA